MAALGDRFDECLGDPYGIRTRVTAVKGLSLRSIYIHQLLFMILFDNAFVKKMSIFVWRNPSPYIREFLEQVEIAKWLGQ
jgi:predicted membrane protein